VIGSAVLAIEGDEVGLRPTPRQGDHLRNLNRRPGHCRARASFRLTPTVRFALRASAHRAHARLRPPAPHSLGLRPKESCVCGLFPALALRTPLGLRPKTPRERLGYAQEKNVQQREGPRRVCRGPSTYRKNHEASEAAFPFSALHFQQKEAPRQGARAGLGA